MCAKLNKRPRFPAIVEKVSFATRLSTDLAFRLTPPRMTRKRRCWLFRASRRPFIPPAPDGSVRRAPVFSSCLLWTLYLGPFELARSAPLIQPFLSRLVNKIQNVPAQTLWKWRTRVWVCSPPPHPGLASHWLNCFLAFSLTQIWKNKSDYGDICALMHPFLINMSEAECLCSDSELRRGKDNEQNGERERERELYFWD